MQVLVVEDEPLVREVLVAAMGGTGWAVCTASSMEEALERDDDFDVVVLDLNLGDSRGSDTVDMARANWHDAALVVYTGSDESGIQGADAVLRKGLDPPSHVVAVAKDAISRRAFEGGASRPGGIRAFGDQVADDIEEFFGDKLHVHLTSALKATFEQVETSDLPGLLKRAAVSRVVARLIEIEGASRVVPALIDLVVLAAKGQVAVGQKPHLRDLLGPG